jgi:putative cell wall-binding protein
VLALALALAAGLVTATAPPASANHINDHRNIILPDPNPNSPTQWSIRWSRETFTAAPRFLLARADDFPDALASGPLQGDSTPLLLTDGQQLSDGIVEEAERLGAVTFDVLGGETAVSDAVVEALQAEGLVLGRRIEGPTRYETAVEAARGGVATTAVLVRGEGADDRTQGFADALAAGGWAAEEGWPVLLTQTDRLHPATAAYLQATPTITRILVVGGTDAVGGTNEADLEALGVTVERIAGDTRADTAIAIARARGAQVVADVDRFLAVEAELAESYALGFAAAAHSAVADAPIVLITSGTIPAATQGWLDGGTARADDVMTGDPLFICAAAPPTCAGPVRDALGLPTVGNNGAAITLATDEGPYTTGDVLTGTATFAEGVEATLALMGPCIDAGDVEVAEDGTFTTELTSTTADEGSETTCTISYRVTYSQGTTQVGAFPVDLAAGDGDGGGSGNPVVDAIEDVIDPTG